MSVKIIVDSTVDFSEKAADRCLVVPLSVFFGEEEYRDGIDMTKDEFYTKLKKCKDLPHTSQASPAVFADIFDEVTKNGDEAIVLTVSSKLSGTFQSASIAAEDYDNIRVIDSLNVAIGTGILAEYGLRLASEGKSLDEIADTLENKKNDVHLVACLDTLTYLQKGGRISKTVAIAGNALSIKPVIIVKDGAIELLGKARGSKKANNFLNTEVEKTGVDYSLPVLLGYSGTSDSMLRTYIDDSHALWANQLDELLVSQIGTVVGTHAGPDAIAVAYFS